MSVWLTQLQLNTVLPKPLLLVNPLLETEDTQTLKSLTVFLQQVKYTQI